MADTLQQTYQKSVASIKAAQKKTAANQTPLVAYDPSDDLLKALGITRSQYDGLWADAKVQVQYLQGLIGKLNSQDYANALSTIQSQQSAIFTSAGSFFKSTHQGTLENLQSLVGGLQAQIPKGYVAPPPPNPQQPGPANQDILQIAPGTTDLTDQQKQQWQSITGQNFDNDYNNFVQNYAAALQNYSITSGAPIGGESLWSKGPATSGLAAGQGFSNPIPLSQLSAQQQGQYSGITKGQFAQMMMTTKVQAAAYAERAVRASWAYGNYPADQLNPLIYNAVNSMDIQSLTQAIQAAGGVQAWATQQTQSGGAVAGVVTEFTAENPQYSAAAQPSGVAGIQSGIEQQNIKDMTTMWNQYFHRAPTQTEIKYFGGWDQASMQAWVNQQQSVDNPTMTVGERTGYLANADAVSQKLWGTPADSRMADLLDGHFNPNASPSSTPANMTQAINQSLAQTSQPPAKS